MDNPNIELDYILNLKWPPVLGAVRQARCDDVERTWAFGGGVSRTILCAERWKSFSTFDFQKNKSE